MANTFLAHVTHMRNVRNERYAYVPYFHKIQTP